jgi:thiol:disulfide interchange protein/DsbC/DsbD-like thiol-disulfide interchange protein
VSLVRKVRAVATALVVFASFAARAQVQASLVAADKSVQPGHSLTVALRLDQQPTWHTYWISAGTGYPTSLRWDLPPGWTAGPIKWPVPIVIRDANDNITGNGYERIVDLPITITPAGNLKTGEHVTLEAQAKWLMCSDICIPGRAKVTLILPVSLGTPQPDEAVRAELARMPMPQSATGWKLAAVRHGKNVTLQLSGAGTVESPRFFSEDGFIQYDQPQTALNSGGSLTFALPISEDAEAATSKLVGVLAYTDEQGVYRGLHIDVPFGSSATAASAAAAGPTTIASGSGPVKSAGTTSGSSSGATIAGLFATLVSALLGGLILNLMPCVFPVLGIKIVGFVNQSGNERRKVTLHGVVFTLGVLVSFWALAGVLAVLRAGGAQLGWGFQLQSPAFVFCLAVVMLIFALSLSGVFEFGLSAMGIGSRLQTKDGYAGTFFTGVLATVVATPCSAPFLAPALGAALALPTAQSFLVFSAIGIGLSSPYLLLSTFPQAVKWLPRPGRWMETFKQLMAFPLYATVGYLIWVLDGQVRETGLLMALLGLTVVAMAIWLYGRYTSPGMSRRHSRLGLAGALVLLVFGLQLGWPRAAAATDITWEPWSIERVQQLRAANRPIYVDFTARWCATCQANKKLVFGSDKVTRYFRTHNVATLKADWTNSDPRITAELAKWNRSAVPFNLVYVPTQSEPKVLPEVLTPSVVLRAFEP